MGTKEKPGQFDCHANALPDEPMFILLGRDPLAPYLTQIWAMIRAGDRQGARRVFHELIIDPKSGRFVTEPDADKAVNAAICSSEMMQWRMNNDGAWRK